MAWWNFMKRPKPKPMTPEDQAALDEAREAVREAKELVRWLMSLDRTTLEALRDEAVEREKRHIQ